jgi:hypothetical protein
MLFIDVGRGGAKIGESMGSERLASTNSSAATSSRPLAKR